MKERTFTIPAGSSACYLLRLFSPLSSSLLACFSALPRGAIRVESVSKDGLWNTVSLCSTTRHKSQPHLSL